MANVCVQYAGVLALAAMTTPQFVFRLGLLLALMATTVAAQTSVTNWDAVKALAAGTPVRVTAQSNTVRRGNSTGPRTTPGRDFREWAGDNRPAAGIGRVGREAGRRKRNTLIGLAVGTGAGLGIGIAARSKPGQLDIIPNSAIVAGFTVVGGTRAGPLWGWSFLPAAGVRSTGNNWRRRRICCSVYGAVTTPCLTEGNRANRTEALSCAKIRAVVHAATLTTVHCPYVCARARAPTRPLSTTLCSTCTTSIFRRPSDPQPGTSRSTPRTQLPYAFRSSAYLFSELDRLGILESEFLIDDNRIVEEEPAGSRRCRSHAFPESSG